MLRDEAVVIQCPLKSKIRMLELAFGISLCVVVQRNTKGWVRELDQKSVLPKARPDIYPGTRDDVAFKSIEISILIKG